MTSFEPIAARHRRFAAAEAHGHPPRDEAFAEGVAGDAEILAPPRISNEAARPSPPSPHRMSKLK